MSGLVKLSLAVGLMVPAAIGYAEEKPRVSALSGLDREFMSAQRARIDNLARVQLGRQLNGDRDNDLEILQRLLNRRLVRADQTLELQAMGVVMGDVLARELDMDWVVYQDKLGRNRALRLPDRDHYLFPVTMISRRVEAAASTDVEAMYTRACNLMAPYRPKPPFRY